jgi:hypothetical protein
MVHITQLSYSVNAVLTEVAVRGDVSRLARRGRSIEPKHGRKQTSVPKEKPYES